jgi:hypothetical protein
MNRPDYPEQAGFKSSGPSEEAARIIDRTARSLRDQVLKIIADSPAGLSADSVADQLGRSVLSVRPRVAELHRLGEIRPTMYRVKNASGLNATVWVRSPPLPGPEQEKDQLAAPIQAALNDRAE